MAIRIRGSSDDQLRALSCGGEGRRVFVLDKLPPIFLRRVADLPHRTQNGLLRLVGGQSLQPLLRGQLNIHTETVCQEPQLMYQFR